MKIWKFGPRRDEFLVLYCTNQSQGNSSSLGAERHLLQASALSRETELERANGSLSLPKMAKRPTWVRGLPRRLPCLYKWHTRYRHAAGLFTSPSARHRLLPRCK